MIRLTPAKATEATAGSADATGPSPLQLLREHAEFSVFADRPPPFGAHPTQHVEAIINRHHGVHAGRAPPRRPRTAMARSARGPGRIRGVPPTHLPPAGLGVAVQPRVSGRADAGGAAGDAVAGARRGETAPAARVAHAAGRAAEPRAAARAAHPANDRA